ncbi:hypothetical protein [Burkholderia lata]|uniref:Uncharacterized protein n=1 Tax=Burkholderia lata (strain ATCC 17760 / DSM 23089 / LMG 22485 / NCIMB 9086 / R18194 / 383) TaxID=482957 RepID=A0A6P2GTF8_BURL3|nr:hypothetical protein [Burkholderia lata]VWB07863.1 hypothetical protein BLA6863_00189 [Burkholderia lata]
MTEEEALQIGRRVIGDAIRRVGTERDALIDEVQRMAESDPSLMVAFAKVGHLLIESWQDSKH